ncbi:MAG: ParB/RepB/Spo0J family partition protein [Candidatus Eisenbacteria bacterium]|nr:ParB/RepB/Spo0J family partition protein [Candidatus Eisenbacteria bacterium]
MQRKALGRGLSALIPERSSFEKESLPDVRNEVVELELERVVPNPLQPRSGLNSAKMAELVNSIREKGVIEPVIVRRQGEVFEIVAGERRFLACKELGLGKVPAIVREIPDNEMLEIALIENLQREDLNPIDEAHAYTRLVDELGLTQEEVARKVGKDRSSVANQMRLLGLPKEIQDSVSRGTLSAGHARALLSISSEKEQLTLSREIQARGLSVREVEKTTRRRGKRRKAYKNTLEDGQVRWAEDQLRTHLGTKVTIAGRGKRGKILIEYYSPADLERLVELVLSPSKVSD